ncbi:MAG: TCR/Tet family MFS transporter [Sphingomonadaceae bacterium]|nr:TCR/Tet family MFS transporter [Sphingomonadaceae bacterium]
MEEKPRKAALRFVLGTIFIYAVGFGIIMPVLPDLVVELADVTLPEATRIGGWLILTYALFQFAFGPLVGNISDRFGRRPVLLLSLAGFSIDYAVMGFAPVIGWLFVGRALAGTFGAAFSTAYATIADIYDEENRARGFGLIGAAFGTGFIVGPAIGGLVGEFGTRLPFFIAAGLGAANLLYGFFVFPETLASENRRPFSLRRANPLGALLKLRLMPGVLPIALVYFFWMTAQQIYPSIWSYFTQIRFGWTPGIIGLSLMWTGMIMAAMQALAVGPMVKRFGERTCAVLALAVSAAGYAMYAANPYGWVVFVIMAVTALGALGGPALSAMMSRRVPADMQGELQGFIASITALTAITAPLIFNPSLAYFSAADAPVYFPGAPWVLAAILAIVALLVLLASRRKRRIGEAASAA